MSTSAAHTDTLSPTIPLPALALDAAALRVIRRSGTLSPWDPGKISAAITKAFLAVEGAGAAGSPRVHDTVTTLTHTVSEALTRRADAARAIHIEDIQDQVELALMRYGEHAIARDYVLYRERRRQVRSTRPAACAVGSGECEACQ